MEKARALVTSMPRRGSWTPEMEEDAAAVIATALDEQLTLLSDPNAVHINMLRGMIAKPSWKQIQHLYPEESRTALDEAREAERMALMSEVSNKACEWADNYPQSSDGRNTFILFAEWARGRALKPTPQRSEPT